MTTGTLLLFLIITLCSVHIAHAQSVLPLPLTVSFFDASMVASSALLPSNPAGGTPLVAANLTANIAVDASSAANVVINATFTGGQCVLTYNTASLSVSVVVLSGSVSAPLPVTPGVQAWTLDYVDDALGNDVTIALSVSGPPAALTGVTCSSPASCLFDGSAGPAAFDPAQLFYALNVNNVPTATLLASFTGGSLQLSLDLGFTFTPLNSSMTSSTLSVAVPLQAGIATQAILLFTPAAPMAAAIQYAFTFLVGGTPDPAPGIGVSNIVAATSYTGNAVVVLVDPVFDVNT
jgi:hypothetical protein